MKQHFKLFIISVYHFLSEFSKWLEFIMGEGNAEKIKLGMWDCYPSSNKF